MNHIEEFLSNLDEAEEVPGGWVALCPVHNDNSPSLRVSINPHGKLLINCQSQHCDFMSIVDALNLNFPEDFENYETTDQPIAIGAANKLPATDEECAQLLTLVDQLAADFINSFSSEYVWERFGVGDDLAAKLKLGHIHPADTGRHELLTPELCSRLSVSVPFLDFNGRPHCLQTRALNNNAQKRWLTLYNPGYGDRRWGAYGVFEVNNSDSYWLLCEGPGDALTAAGSGFNAIGIRGSKAVLKNALPDIITRLPDAHIFLAGDNDAAGQLFNKEAGKQLTSAGIEASSLAIPAEHSDLGDWFAGSGGLFHDELFAALRTAEQFSETPPAATAATTSAKSFPLTDAGNGERLLAWLGGDIRHTAGRGVMVYTGSHWEQDTLNKLDKELLLCLRDMQQQGEEKRLAGLTLGNTDMVDLAEAEINFAVRCENKTRFENAKEMAKIGSSIDDDEFDTRPYLLSCSNGTVDLRTGELRPHQREDYLTHCLGFNYDPETKAPLWEKTIKDIFVNHPELVNYVQVLCGYIATGSMRENIVVICHGTGANGKSLMWSTIEYILKPLTRTTSFSTFEKRQSGSASADLAQLAGARLVLCQEGETGAVMAESLIKRISGRDTITARHLYRPPMEFKPSFTVVLATNHLPQIRGQDDGLKRRLKIIPFDRFFLPEERDNHLDWKLQDESEGILNWLVQGAMQYHTQQGLGEDPIVAETTSDYFMSADILEGFIGDIVTEHPGSVISYQELLNKYVVWAQLNNERYTLNKQQLAQAVIERVRGSRRHRLSSGMGVGNIAFVDDVATREVAADA
jgi:putative DNA primase/helicase